MLYYCATGGQRKGSSRSFQMKNVY